MAFKKKDNSFQLYSKLCKDIQAKKYAFTYFLYGEETFLLEDVIKKLKSRLLDPTTEELNYSFIDGEGNPSNVSWENVKNNLFSAPFMSEKRLVLIRNSGLVSDKKLAKEQEELMLQCLSHDNPQACLIFYEDKVDRRYQKSYKLIQKHADLVQLNYLEENQLTKWVAGALGSKKLAITEEAASDLIYRCENKMLLLSKELQKIVLYAQANSLSRINSDLIKDLALPNLQGEIFNLTDAIAKAKTEEALRLYRLLRSKKEANMRILFSLARQLRQLMSVKSIKRDEDFRAYWNLSPYIISRLKQQAKAFKMDELHNMYGQCADIDSRIKWGKINEDIALEYLIIRLSTKTMSVT